MEQVILREYVAQADWLVAKRQRQVAHQREIVGELECAGRNSRDAKKLLRQSEGYLLLQVADRDWLHRHLGL